MRTEENDFIPKQANENSRPKFNELEAAVKNFSPWRYGNENFIITIEILAREHSSSFNWLNQQTHNEIASQWGLFESEKSSWQVARSTSIMSSSGCHDYVGHCSARRRIYATMTRRRPKIDMRKYVEQLKKSRKREKVLRHVIQPQFLSRPHVFVRISQSFSTQIFLQWIRKSPFSTPSLRWCASAFLPNAFIKLQPNAYIVRNQHTSK